MQNFPNSASTSQQPRHLNLRFQGDKIRLQEIFEEDADDPDGETLPIEFEVLYSVDEENSRASAEEIAEQHQNESVVPTNAKPAQWTRPAIYYLIGFYKQLARSEILGKTSFGPTAIWTEVSKKLRQRGYTCTPEQCRTKWLLLKKLYQHIRNESQILKFDFVEAMHDYLKNPIVENLLQQIKRKAEEQPAIKRRGPKRKYVKEENEEELDIKENNTTAAYEEFSYKSSVSNNDVHEIDMTENNVKTEEEEHVGKSPQSIVIGEDLTEGITQEYSIDFESQKESPVDYEETVSNEEHSGLSILLETDDSPQNALENNFLQLKNLIELQEHRRNERHNEKLQMFREYNERLLSQQSAAITMHKVLMERLINSL